MTAVLPTPNLWAGGMIFRTSDYPASGSKAHMVSREQNSRDKMLQFFKTGIHLPTTGIVQCKLGEPRSGK